MFQLFLRVHVPRRAPRQPEGAAVLARGRRHPGEIRSGEARAAGQAAVPHGHRVRDARRAGGAGPRPGRHAHPVPPHLREDPGHRPQGHDLQVRYRMHTGWGGHLFRRICNMFSKSSPCLVGQHCSCSIAQQPVELSKNSLQNLLNKWLRHPVRLL